MIEIPALKHKSKSYPARFQGRVPKRIRMLVTIHPEPIFAGKIPSPIFGQEYEAWTNSYGAVAVLFEDGQTLGVKPDEFEVTEWYYSGPHDSCFLNPRENKPSEYLLGNYRDVRPKPTNGCQNEATLRVGSKEVWHLCEECAKLPRFKRFRVREKLKRSKMTKTNKLKIEIVNFISTSAHKIFGFDEIVNFISTSAHKIFGFDEIDKKFQPKFPGMISVAMNDLVAKKIIGQVMDDGDQKYHWIIL